MSQECETEKFEIRFTVYAEPGTHEYELLCYLKKNKRMSRDRLKEMAMAALTGYYLPAARIGNSAVTKDQQHLAVLEGIQRLRLQQQYFRELGGLCEAEIVTEPESTAITSQKISNTQALQPKLTNNKEVEFDPEEMF